MQEPRETMANEAEVRFALANLIVNMLCAVHGFFLAWNTK